MTGIGMTHRRASPCRTTPCRPQPCASARVRTTHVRTDMDHGHGHRYQPRATMDHVHPSHAMECATTEYRVHPKDAMDHTHPGATMDHAVPF